MNTTVSNASTDEIVAKPRHSLRQFALKWHKTIGIVGGFALILWGVSGLLHPLMSTIGPQQAVFYPPTRVLELEHSVPIQSILADVGIEQAAAIRVIVAEKENLLQITTRALDERRYFSLANGKEIPNYDAQHAAFLARHYLALDATTGPAVREIRRLTEFTADYPWVNRLLPVYRIEFDRSDNLTAYIYTETNALAGVTNRLKTKLQSGFRGIHTWSWIPQKLEWLRIVLMLALVGALFTMAGSGLVMLIGFRRNGRALGLRGWHRISAYALVVPIAMFTLSGIYHLIQYSVVKPAHNLRLSSPVSLHSLEYPIHEQWPSLTAGLDVNNLSIVQDANGRILYRLGLPAQPNGSSPATAQAIRNARFDGVASTGPALYLDANSGEPWAEGDKELALQLGERFTKVERSAIESASLVTRFGLDYDFRNKRLPVWRLEYGAPINATIFVDTVTGVLADLTHDYEKPERLSFSLVHKWNFLFPLGRGTQNSIVSIVVFCAVVLMAVFGLKMDLARRARIRKNRRIAVNKN